MGEEEEPKQLRPKKKRNPIRAPASDFASMVDQMVADKGWTLEYVLALTYRQFECLYERMWDRKTWEIEVTIKTGPFGGGDDEKDKPEAIDATTDGGLAYLTQNLGINVKKRAPTPGLPVTDPV